MRDALLERFQHHDRRALARLLSLLARGEKIAEILAELPAPQQLSRVVAITGSAGVGKSSLIGKLLETIRKQGPSVAVLACDPESPLSGGALLGDRFRMATRPEDNGVFIRSLAAASDRGVTAEHLDAMIRLLEAFGFDVIIIETVGAGQGDTAVRTLADVLVLLLQPETGDDLQWEKAGVLEVADVIVIHKADLPAAETVAQQVDHALSLTNRPPPPILRVSARTKEGLPTLWQTITALPLRRKVEQAVDGYELLQLTEESLKRRFQQAQQAQDKDLQQLLARWRQGQVQTFKSVSDLLSILSRYKGSD